LMLEREDRVRALMAAANTGMLQLLQDHSEYSAVDVFSAYLTLTASLIQVLHELHIPNRAIRAGIEQLLLRCPSDTGTVN